MSENNSKTTKNNNCNFFSTDSEDLNQAESFSNIPLGRSGPLIGIFPIVLADFDVKIQCKLSYKKPVSLIETLSNKILLTNLKLVNNNEFLFISGYVRKKALVFINNNKRKTIFNIPFKSVVKINYSTTPNFSQEYKTSKNKNPSFYENLQSKDNFKIEVDIKSLELTENLIQEDETTNPNYLISIIVSLKLTQNQEVFIAETLKQAKVVSENGDGDRENPKLVNLGSDSDKNLIAEVFK